MFLFSKQIKKSIILDYSRKVNVKVLQQLENKGEELRLSFSLQLTSCKSKKQRIKNLLVLELLALQKAFFVFQLNKTKRKKVFVPFEARVSLMGKHLDYFCCLFSKNNVGYIKNLAGFYAHTENRQKANVEPASFPLVLKKAYYFNDIKEIQIQKNITFNHTHDQRVLTKLLNRSEDQWVKQKVNENNLQMLSFYRFFL